MRLGLRSIGMTLSCVVGAIVSGPAAAQVFWQSPDYRGAPLLPGDPGLGVTLPGATIAEERANWA